MTIPPFRLAVLPDFPDEGWASMDLCAEMLLANLPTSVTGIRAIPPYRRRFTRLPGVGRSRFAVNADRLANRYFAYPRFARSLREADAYHVVDHSYAHLVRELPAGRTGVYCHDLDAFRCLLEPQAEPRPRWFRSLMRRVLSGMQSASVVLATSRTTHAQILQLGLIDPAKLIEAPLGVAPEFHEHSPAEPIRLSALDALNGRPWLLHVGSTIPRKRIDLLLEMFALARREIPELHLVKVGGEWTPGQREQIDRLGVASDITHLVGLPRSELAEVYRRATVVLIPSEAEGFGLPVIEALACGAPVVASDISALREAGGTAATYRPVGDLPAWVQAIVDTIRGDTTVTAKPDRLAWASRFRWQTHAATVAEAYAKLLGK